MVGLDENVFEKRNCNLRIGTAICSLAESGATQRNGDGQISSGVQERTIPMESLWVSPQRCFQHSQSTEQNLSVIFPRRPRSFPVLLGPVVKGSEQVKLLWFIGALINYRWIQLSASNWGTWDLRNMSECSYITVKCFSFNKLTFWKEKIFYHRSWKMQISVWGVFWKALK